MGYRYKLTGSTPNSGAPGYTLALGLTKREAMERASGVREGCSMEVCRKAPRRPWEMVARYWRDREGLQFIEY